MSKERLEELLDDTILEYFGDVALCGVCGHYYCTCCGCDCWLGFYEEEEDESE